MRVRATAIGALILAVAAFVAIQAGVWEWIITERRVTADSQRNFVVERRLPLWGKHAGKPHGITRVRLRSGREYTFRYENGKFSGATGEDQGTFEERRTVATLVGMNAHFAFENLSLEEVFSFFELISDVNILWEGIDGDTPVNYKGNDVLLGSALGEVVGNLGCRFDVGSNGDIRIVPHDSP